MAERNEHGATRTPGGEAHAPDDPSDVASDEGGDAPCWAHRVCQECGRLNEAERPERCEACGAVFDR